MTKALLREDEAKDYVGGLPERTFDLYFGDRVIRLGNRKYYRPEDLDDVVDGLAYGSQPEAGK